MISKQLVDSYGRRVRKLRISLTDKCNMRCHYCMPIDAQFMDESKYLSADQYYTITKELCDYGLEEIRLTGGEPLMRKSFSEITEKLARLPLKKIGMTTNAVMLDKYFDVLKKNRVQHLNISLDSLRAERFHSITYGNHLDRVLKNIRAAVDLGFSVKINVVAMKGINDDEIFDFVDYSRDLGIEVRFLELMRIGFACGNQKAQFISAEELIAQLKTRYALIPKAVSGDSTSFNYKTFCGAEIGFIASESKAFCGTCSRWRLSADGILRACLLKDDGLNAKSTTAAERDRLYHELLGMKPGLRPAEVLHQMNTIGG